MAEYLGVYVAYNKALTILAGLVLLALVLWEQKQFTGSRRRSLAQEDLPKPSA